MDLTKILTIAFSILLHGVAAGSASQNYLQPCRLYVVKYTCMRDDGNCPNTTLDCEFEDNLYPVKGVSADWIEEQVSTERIVSGESELIVSDYQISVGEIDIPESSLGTLDIKTDRRRRRLGPSKTGPSTVLVVRVKATDGAPNYSERELSDYFFGTGSGTSLLSQMDACSSGQTTIVPAVHSAMSFPGVVEVDIGITLDGNSGDDTVSVIRAAAISELSRMGVPFGDYDSVNFVIQTCSPDRCPFGGYAAVNGWYSLYRGFYATMSSVMIHTYGHQMGLYGSDALRNDKLAPDNDFTCSMGKALYEVDAHMCYNAVKHIDLGWFSSGDSLVAVEDLPQVYEIIGYAEWDSGAEGVPVSLTIDSKIVVSFNRAIGVNKDTAEGPDQVIVHDAEYQSNGNSLLVAVLATGEEHEYIYKGTPTGYIVKVCEIGGDTSVIATRARVLVYDSSVGVSSCPSFLPSKLPSDQPSKIPAKMPSDQPSKLPSDKPSSLPSKKPSKMPSDQPSTMPSDQPSEIPTSSPSGCITIDDCDDGDICTIDRCNKFHECTHEVIPKCCESVAECDDKQVCTIDTCYNNRCKYAPRPNFCCDASDCDDGDSCTIDECDGSKCKNTRIEGCCEIESDCDDGDPCTLHQCVNGKCKD
eukprot:CAMPEP_0194268598 /NCGR_PEP_ID=MMETSP0169-20130528/2884_1 /TAXON_ID=218684 /ORGANISM="Corethron pennatum, Strain L29A3" /LENGTH=640 /DNA_ID=CAMNT_0039009881 /DNA_START=154 /DNA_END=2073 /DNA_ORIENTATION=-